MTPFGRLLVLGIGSRLMGDDGIGPRVADTLRETARPGREVLAAETDFGYALEYLRPGDHVVLIDAVQSGAAPGSVRVFPAAQVTRKLSQHEACWEQLCHMGAADCVLIGIEAAEIRECLSLSPRLKARFPEICREIAGLLDAIEDACVLGLA